MKNDPVLTPTATFIATIVLTLMLGIIDWVSGYELQFFIFYFLPVGIVAWMCNLKRICFVVGLCTLTWFAADWFSGNPYTHIGYAIWNTIIRLVAFLILGYAIFEIKVLLDVERKISADLQKALSEVKTLTGLLPICAGCKKIRNDTGYWQQLEEYIEHHSEASFTHGYCQQCAEKLLRDAGIDPSTLHLKIEGASKTNSP
ncbi:MAG: hypothetical protein WCJ02_06620 [bacterium]